MKFNYFSDALLIYLDYISRQFKKNPNYKPHSLIRALANAMEGIETAKDGESVSGASFEGEEDSIYEPYMVILQKKKNTVEVKDIINLKVNRQIPVDVMIIVFRLQIQLDRIEGETVNPQQVTDVLNTVIPGNKFYFLGDKWVQAREKFKKLLNERKISLPSNDPKLVEFRQIEDSTSWENYSNRLRALIGASTLKYFDKEAKIAITTPKNVRIEKYKVFDIAMEFLLGKASRYFKPFKK